ncbi:MAG TPA: DUF4870 domain-containing protein [Opitutales bacterium]|jgi:uncharacterized Tic20 family protein|nr:DUF4870 domain-containing protein [Opitutales bacterium]
MRNDWPPFTNPPPRGDEKIWSMLSHLSVLLGFPFILPLVVYLAMRKDSDFAAANAREALNFHLSVILYILLCLPLCLLLIGLPIYIGLIIGWFALGIYAAYKASNGICYHYPLTIPFLRNAAVGSIV